MLEKVTGWSIRHPRKVIALWVLMVAAVMVFGGRVEVNRSTEADLWVGESGRTTALLREAGHSPHKVEMVHLSGNGSQAAAEQLTARWRHEGVVKEVAPTAVSKTDGSRLVRAELTALSSADEVDIQPLINDVSAVQRNHPGATLQQFGSVTSGNTFNRTVGKDLSRAETTSLPVTLVIMLAVFGSLIAAGLPIVIALLSVTVSLGLGGVLSRVFPQEPTVTNMIVLMGMAVGVDYCLFYLKREREERARGCVPVDAVRIAARTSGHAVVTSGVAVVLSLAGLFVMDYAVFNSLALGAISVVLVAVAASLTLLPALMTASGRWLDRLRIPGLHGRLARVERARRQERPVSAGGIGVFGRIVSPVVRRPVLALVAGTAAASALMIPALSLRTAGSSIDSLPPTHPLVKTYRSLEASFPSQGTGATVVSTFGPGGEKQVRAQLVSVAAQARGQGWAVAGAPVLKVGAAQLDLATTAAGQNVLTSRIRELREITDSTLTAHHGVTGDAAENVDASTHLADRMPWAVAAILGLTSLIMTITFGSVIIGLVTAGLNLISAGIAFGVLAVVFQSDIGARMLNFTNLSAVRDWVPMLLLSILVGLSMDYHVFVLSRIRENVRSGMSTRSAIIEGVGRTGSVITSAAIVMVAVFSIFATLSLAEMKQLGVGLSVAIAIDATLVRLVLLPALLALLGRRAWGRGTDALTPVQNLATFRTNSGKRLSHTG